MTTVVVVRKAGQIAIAADTLVTFGDTRLANRFEDNTKIFKVDTDAGPSYVGMAGTVAHFPVLRKAIGSGRVYGETQALSPMEAVRCATANGAYLTFDEAKKGSLEAGKFADLAVLSADPLSVSADRISAITALMTMVGGKIVHETAGWQG